jgi:hypothetical protein
VANEIKMTLGVNYANGQLTDALATVQNNYTQNVPGLHKTTVTVAVTESALDLSALATPGWVILQNLDPTNYVRYGPASAGAMVPFARLLPGEKHALRLGPAGISLRWISNAAPVQVLVTAYND